MPATPPSRLCSVTVRVTGSVNWPIHAALNVPSALRVCLRTHATRTADWPQNWRCYDRLISSV